MDDSHRNTVYDLTALRLHTDSTRVHQTSDNLTLGKRKDTVHNPRRGWFAKDAGGSLVINNSTKKSSKRKTSNANDDDKNPGKDDTTATVTTEQEVGERGRTMKRKNVDSNVQSEKARKKQKFKEDDTFITKLTQNVTDEYRDDAPSSDLLKSIHHHSANFYKQRGVLYAPRKTKHQAKKRKEKSQNEFINTPPSSQPRHPRYEECESLEEDNGAGEYLEPLPGPPESPTPSKNMYRGLEGSFLLGLGVLTQEKTARLLESKTPQKDDSVRKAGAYPTPYPSCIRDSSESDDDVPGEKVMKGGKGDEEVKEEPVDFEFEEWYGITPISDGEEDKNTGKEVIGESNTTDVVDEEDKDEASGEVESEEITQFTSDDEDAEIDELDPDQV